MHRALCCWVRRGLRDPVVQLKYLPHGPLRKGTHRKWSFSTQTPSFLVPSMADVNFLGIRAPTSWRSWNNDIQLALIGVPNTPWELILTSLTNFGCLRVVQKPCKGKDYCAHLGFLIQRVYRSWGLQCDVQAAGRGHYGDPLFMQCPVTTASCWQVHPGLIQLFPGVIVAIPLH